MKGKQKRSKKSQKNAAQKSGSSKWIALLGILLLVAAYFIYRQLKSGSDSLAPYEEEATLRADKPTLRLLGSNETGISFVNSITETPENNILKNTNFYNGGGMAIADINNDGLPDLYFINCDGQNGLYLNEGKLKFKDITKGSGLESPGGFETSVTAADVNADGYLDFYVCLAGPFDPAQRRNRLFINNKDLTFSERGAAYGLDAGSMSTGANFFDYDRDGDLDLYLLNYPTNFGFASKIEADIDPATNTYRPRLKPKSAFDSDRLYRNDGNGKFTDVSKQAGIENFAYGLSTGITDFNQDGWPDIYVGNDFIQPDLLYINNKNGTFTNQLGRYFKHTAQHTMGTDFNDFDNDGLIDLLAVDMLPVSHYRQKTTMSTNSQTRYNTLIQYGYFEPVVRNVLQRNNGNGSFSDIGCLAGVYKTDWSWSGLMFDMDNDGYKDMAITNGYRRELADMDYMNFTVPKLQGSTIESFDDVFKYIPIYKIRNFVYQNRGNWTFEDMSGKWLDVPASWSNGAAWADLDKDGDLDWIVSNLEDEAFVYENLTTNQNNGNYLQIKTIGSKKNPFAIGASALIKYAGQTQYQELTPTRGIFSSVEHLIHFGLGKAEQVDALLVRWPDGQTTSMQNVAANQRLTLRQAEANGREPLAAPSTAALFKDITQQSNLAFKHIENIYNDFDATFLLPWKLSDLGPAMASADVNGDGLEDLFIGNAFNTAAGLYLQTAGGKFRASSAAVWETDNIYEDAGSTFFDADGDGDQDLFVLNGGPEADEKGQGIDWGCRLYKNDGKGNFTKEETAPPALQNVAMQLATHDYDGDGDLDLFIGGRTVAGRYPTIPESVVLQNNKGQFVDVSDQVAGDFRKCGMVTDLQWANVDSDTQKELIVVGEWMAVSIFKLDNGQLKNVSANFGLQQSNGLWNSLTVSDLDNDGDLDLLTGNFGHNSRLVAAADEPLRCYGYDFDQNGSIEPVLSYFEDGKEYPLMRQDALVKQLPPLKKKFLYHKDYARATIDDVFDAEQLKAAQVLEAHTLSTGWWENKNGRFVFHALPLQAQVAPTYGFIVADFNGDTHADILLAGNKYGIEVETGRCDAGIGALFLGNSRGQFNWQANTKTGFFAAREVRDMQMLQSAGGSRTIVVANNNGPVQVFELR